MVLRLRLPVLIVDQRRRGLDQREKLLNFDALVHVRQPADVVRLGLLVQEGRERFTNGRVTALLSVVIVRSEKRSRRCSTDRYSHPNNAVS